MTLMNGFAAGGRVKLYADSAWLGMPSGEVIAFGGKIMVGLHWPYAVVMSYLRSGEWMHDAVKRAGAINPPDLPSLLAFFADDLRAYQAANDTGEARLLIGAFDRDLGRCRLMFMASRDLGFCRPFEAVDCDHFTCSGNETAAYQLATRAGWSRKRMLGVIDAQRREPLRHPDYGEVYGIGGTVAEVTVAADGLSSRDVRRWRDVLGEPIRPHRRDRY